MKKVTSGGGWPAIRYALRMAKQSGGIIKFYQALKTRNTCKTCALGMGGQRGGMVDERGRFPEICKKSMQAMAADMQPAIDDEFFAHHSLSDLAGWSPRNLESLGRLTTPLIAREGDDRYRPTTWDDALDRCAAALKVAPPEQAFFYASGRSSNEAGFLLQLFARLYGTNHVNNCSYYCHQASGVGLTSSIGSGTATITLDDIDKCDTFFLIGGNPASNHPRLMRQLMELRRRGGSVIVINPLRETGLVRFSVPSDLRSLLISSEIASEYVQPHIGGDRALLCGIAKRIIETGDADEGFVRDCTEGRAAFGEFVDGLSWPEIVESSGVDQPTIARIADVYAKSQRTIFSWTMGITHHIGGADNVRAIVNLALLRGMVARPGAGLMPIRGHSNVQGIGSVGVTPALKKAIFERLETHFGVRLPTSKGLDTLGCIDAMADGKMRAGWCLGGNLFGATPDPEWVRSAFKRLDSLVYLSTTLNTGHVHGRAKETIILPVLARDEEPEATTQESMFSFVRLSDGGPARHDGPRSEVAVIAEVAGRVLGAGGPIDWSAIKRHQTIRQAIDAVVPGYEKIAAIDETKQEFHVEGRTIHTLEFPTPTGRAAFKVTPLPKLERTSATLQLMTIRSEGQFNTVVYEEGDLYRHQERRDVILMSAADIKRLNLHIDQRVTVRSGHRSMPHILVREFNIRPGNAAMYYPEANILVPRDADPETKTPAFKSVPVTIEADGP